MGNAEEMRNHGTRLDDGTSSVELQDFVDIFADLGIKKKYRKKKLKPLKGMLRDIEIPKKEIALLLLIFNSLSCILIVSLFINITLLKSGNILSINEMTPWLLTGIIAGIFFSFFRDLFIKRRLLLVSALLIFSFIVLTIQITILPFNLNVIEPILYLTDSFVVIILFILFMNLFLEYSNLLERGRVLSFLLIENIIFSLLISIVIGFGVINASFFLYFPLILLPFTVYYIQKNQDLERTPSTPSLFKEKHINKSLIKYAVFIFFFSFMIGIGVPLIDVEDSIRMIFIYEEIDITIIHTLILVIASSTLIFLIFGVIFDYIGRLATISGLILFVSIVSFINVFNTPLELLKEAIILGGLVIGIMASALIVGDITKKKIIVAC